jgi:hypothetical protein
MTGCTPARSPLWRAGQQHAALCLCLYDLYAGFGRPAGPQWFRRRVPDGPLDKDDVRAMTDLNRRELWTFLPLIALVVWMGVYPKTFMQPMGSALESVVARLHPVAGESK